MPLHIRCCSPFICSIHSSPIAHSRKTCAELHRNCSPLSESTHIEDMFIQELASHIADSRQVAYPLRTKLPPGGPPVETMSTADHGIECLIRERTLTSDPIREDIVRKELSVRREKRRLYDIRRESPGHLYPQRPRKLVVFAPDPNSRRQLCSTSPDESRKRLTALRRLPSASFTRRTKASCVCTTEQGSKQRSSAPSSTSSSNQSLLWPVHKPYRVYSLPFPPLGFIGGATAQI